MVIRKKQLVQLKSEKYLQAVVLWGEVVQRFLNEVDLRPSTLESYKRRLKQFVLWLDNNKITNPSSADLIEYKKDITSRCNSMLTISNYLTAVRSLLAWTHRRGIYPNISEEVRNPQRPRGYRRDALELDQVKVLLSSIDRVTLKDKRDYAMIRLLVATGERGIEIHRASIEDIRKEKGKWVLYLQGKGRDEKDEFVVLAKNVLSAIEDYLFCRNSKSKKAPLFASLSTNYYDKRLSTKSIRKIVKDRLKEIGINSPRLSAHSCRHTCVTLSLLAGNTLQETKELARHADVNTTLLYAHNLKRLEGNAEESIEQLIEQE